MASYGQSRETSASPDRVWAVWSDTATWKNWNPNVKEMEMDGPFAEGTTGRMHTNQGRTHHITLANVQPGKGFDLHTKVIPGTNFTFHCTIEGKPAGSTVSQSIEVKGPLGPIFGPMAGKQIADTFGPLLEGLAKASEG